MGQGKVLVTGGTGYIGSHTVIELQNAGYEVVIIDNLFTSRAEIIDRIEEITDQRPEFHKFDLCNYEQLRIFFNHHKDIESVIHFAAFKSVGESVKEPLKYYNNNLVSLMNLLKIAEDTNLKYFVFSSSCTVYGEPDEIPVSESAPIKKAESAYGNTKQICEEILEEQSRAEALKVISLRYFNPIGAHESSKIGEFPVGKPENLVPFLTQTAIGKREKLTVFGNDYPTPDGTCIRDFIHVVDVAKAHVVAIYRMLSSKSEERFEVFNLGTGTGYSVLETIKTFEKVTGVKVNYEIGAHRPGDVIKVFADTTKANQVLGWKAKYNLEDMLKSAWNWEKHLAETGNQV